MGLLYVQCDVLNAFSIDSGPMPPAIGELTGPFASKGAEHGGGGDSGPNLQQRNAVAAMMASQALGRGA